MDRATKWHLGDLPFYPEKHGFDRNVAASSAAQPPVYFAPYGISTLPDGPKGEYLTDRLTTESVKILEDSAG